MGRVAEKGVASGVRNLDQDRRAVLADAVEFLDDAKKALGRRSKMLQDVDHMDFIGRIGFERPWERFKVGNPVWGTCRELVDVDKAIDLSIAASEVEFQRNRLLEEFKACQTIP